MRGFTLRFQPSIPDREAIGQLLDRAGVFRPEEIAVALELVDETLNCADGPSYRWVLADLEVTPAAATAPLGGLACYGPVSMTDGTFDLYWIAVDPLVRGCGVADALDDAVTDVVRRQSGRWLLAETSSTPPYEPARRFYLRRGYTLLERIPDFYRERDDRLTYGKRLDC